MNYGTIDEVMQKKTNRIIMKTTYKRNTTNVPKKKQRSSFKKNAAATCHLLKCWMYNCRDVQYSINFILPALNCFFFFFQHSASKTRPPKDADVENTVKLNAFMERRGSRLGVQMYLDFDRARHRRKETLETVHCFRKFLKTHFSIWLIQYLFTFPELY